MTQILKTIVNIQSSIANGKGLLLEEESIKLSYLG